MNIPKKVVVEGGEIVSLLGDKHVLKLIVVMVAQ